MALGEHVHQVVSEQKAALPEACCCAHQPGPPWLPCSVLFEMPHLVHTECARHLQKASTFGRDF